MAFAMRRANPEALDPQLAALLHLSRDLPYGATDADHGDAGE